MANELDDKRAGKNAARVLGAKTKETNTKDIVFNIDTIATQAHGVLATCGGTTILCTTVVGPRVVADFVPLSVHYIEKFSAVNKMPGGYKKREGAASDGEILITRAIDRALRAIIPAEFTHEVQVTVQVLSYDGYACQSLAIAAASLSLNLAHVTHKLIAAVKVTSCDDGMIINKSSPRMMQLAGNGSCDLLQAVCDDKIIMLEFMGNNISRSLLKTSLGTSAANIKKMQLLGMQHAKEIIELQKKVLKHVKHKYKTHNLVAVKSNMRQKLEAELSVALEPYFAKLGTFTQAESRVLLEDIRSKFMHDHHGNIEQQVIIQHLFDEVLTKNFANKLFAKKKRLDGRAFDAIRAISMSTSFLPALHGSSVFTRGDTQALVSVAIAPFLDAQSVESLHGMHKENFLLHYNFLPYAVYEIGKVGAVSRRDIGHGELARRAFLSQLPKKLDCAIRILSDITASNGSSSMATVCGASLALFDAGVALENHVAGISIGLIEQVVRNKTKYQLLADITGYEDALGLMDFKVAATKTEITAMQLDIKNEGIPLDVISDAIDLAIKHIKKILAKMYQTIDAPKDTMHGVQETIKIDPSKVRLVIGKNGVVVNELTEKFNVKIDIDRSGKIVITPGMNATKSDIQNVVERIKQIAA